MKGQHRRLCTLFFSSPQKAAGRMAELVLNTAEREVVFRKACRHQGNVLISPLKRPQVLQSAKSHKMPAEPLCVTPSCADSPAMRPGTEQGPGDLAGTSAMLLQII